MKFIKGKQWLAITLVAMLLVLAGCQSIGGLNVAKVVENSLKVTSGESSQTLSVELVPSVNAGLTDEDKKMIKLINSLKLDIDHAVTQDLNHASVQGKITYSDKSIPFQLGMDNTNLSLWIEGIKKPIAISLEGEGLDSAVTAELQKSQDGMKAAIQKLGAYFVKQAPVPNTASVSSVTENVYGQSLNLQKLHLEIKGDEVVGLVKTLLTNISKDDEGLREIVKVLYEAFYPIVEQEMSALSEEGLEGDIFGSVAKDQEVGSLVMYKAIKQGLDEVLKQYDEQSAALLAEDEYKQIFSKDTSLSWDIFVDSDNQIRKQNLELGIALPKAADLPISKIIVRSSTQMWNINKPVKADVIDTAAGVDQVDMYGLSGKGFLSKFDKKSSAYSILRNDLGVGAINVTIYPEESYGYEDYLPGWWTLNGTGMVPINYVADQFEADVKWDPATKQITVYDELNDITVQLKIGSKTATVNGVAKTMAQPVIVDDYNTANVPLRFMIEALGAGMTWDPEYAEFYVTRD
ncbi:hypothetical protein BVG16_17965 [Paenibacillus selenitireducens]|uniref:Copper amine oxidase-like N-terminal domain-containing protein n=1 Tax=Paenibacillus selenitireducens TaxID=1324314 RepID=A0A1T2X8B4_9BACL|nr:copper amine oxidase N-terminal domain-containing protein [Paenibacillus selenitireducens]OPA76104.1 hypothetical protein BVG16_17965 [Paenibacillus selenitireducens]